MSSSLSSSLLLWDSIEVYEHPAFNNTGKNKKYQYIQIYQLKSCPSVTIVNLHNPKKHNAINSIMWKEIGILFSQLGKIGDNCRCILLTSSGNTSFCSGIDLFDPKFTSTILNTTTTTSDNIDHTDKNTKSIDPIRDRIAHFLPMLYDMQQCFTNIELCPTPVICAIQDGVCYGGGIDLICCTDIRYCTSNTLFSVKEVQIGLTPDVGTIQRLPKLIKNQSFVNEICYTGRIFTGQEAYDMGLVSHMYNTNHELYNSAIQLCCSIASNSPIAIHGTKQSLLYSRDHTIDDGLKHIALYNALALSNGHDITKAFYKLHSKGMKDNIEFDAIPKYSKL